MIILNVIRLDGSKQRIEYNETLIDYVHDNCLDYSHIVFKGPAGQCSSKNVIHPENRDEFLSSEGEYTICEVPAGVDPLSILITVVVAIAASALVYSLMNVNIEDPGTGQNNSLTNRQNKERPLERIEDIAGTVISNSTLIQQPYKKWIDTKTEADYATMCVGVGEYEVQNARENKTNIEFIAGAGAVFYGPYQMPSVGSSFKTFGTAFTEELKVYIESTEVSNEVLDFEGEGIATIPTDSGTYDYDSGTGEGSILRDTGPFGLEIYTFAEFEVGDAFTLSATFDDGGVSTSLSGSYTVTEVLLEGRGIKFTATGGLDVTDENSNWALITGTEKNDTDLSAQLSTATDPKIVGPFVLESENRTEFQVNITANGLRTDDKNTLRIDFYIEYAQADEDGNRIGSWIRHDDFIQANTPDRVGKSINIVTPFEGPCLVRLERTTGDTDNSYQIINLEYLYSIEPMNVSDFGNVTTVQVRTLANARASALSNRQFNCLVTRKLPIVREDLTIGDSAPTNRFIDYFIYAALDPFIGRRSMAELDITSIYSVYDQIADHFDSEEACEFSYTFDNDQVTLQDTLQYVANAAFCYAVRKGGVFSIRPNIPRAPSTLFTHRSKSPGAQTITRTFNSEEEKDGLEYNYIDPKTGAKLTIVLPENTIPSRPEKYEAIGVRNHNQAWWHAWRRYYELTLRRISVKDTLLSEGFLLAVNDVVSISNDVMSMPQSGSVLEVSGLMLKLSQPVEFADADAEYSIALRLQDGTIDSIRCFEGPSNHYVILERAPVSSLYVGYNQEKSSFIFNKDDPDNAIDIIVTSVDRANMYEVPITGVNYSEKFFSKDGEQSPNN